VSSFAVTAEQITVLPHPNADSIELAQVGAYRAVVAKGQYHTGDIAVYIPEQAILPKTLITELGLTGRLAGKAKDRVKAIRLRGELSQGIVCRPSIISPEQLAVAFAERRDLSGLLSITKWVPEVPTNFSGQLISAPDFLTWIDIENIKRFPDIFFPGETVNCTEKVHGTACCVTWSPGGTLQVSSKGLGAKHTAIAEDPGNIYWQAVRQGSLDKVCVAIAEATSATQVGLYGEVYGPGVQDLHYGLASKGYACFDARVVTENSPHSRWLERDELSHSTAGLCDLVPVLYEGPYDFETLSALAEGAETLSGQSTHIREGLVIRATPERSGPFGRAIAKLVSGAYLTRKDGTEYE